METAMEDGDCLSQDEESAWKEELDVAQLCRVCANPNDYLIPIFQGEGLEHELELKIAKHLPIKVSVKDKLPTNLCYQCASTLIAWHDMVIGCVEADEKLKALTQDKNEEYSLIEDMNQSNEEDFQADAKRDSICGNDQFKLINNAVTITEEEDINRINSLETEQIAIEEQITSLDPEFVEEVASDIRCVEMEEDDYYDGKPKGYYDSDINLEDELMSDVESDDEEYSTLYNCNICKSANMPLEDFLSHTKLHTKEEKQLVLSRMVHSKIVHEEAAKSAAATFGFKVQENLESSVTLYQCIVCGQGNLLLKSVKEHSKLHPHHIDSHFCNICQKQFPSHRSLTSHLEVHLDNNDLFCQYCNKRFCTIDDLEVHEDQHDLAEYMCVDCRKGFRSKELVLLHLKETHSEDTMCLICDQEFKSDHVLTKHFMEHTVVRAMKRVLQCFTCDLCGKKHNSKISLQRHKIFLHNDRLPFICEHCGFVAYHKNLMDAHLKKEHRKKEDKCVCSKCGTVVNQKQRVDTHALGESQLLNNMCKFCGIKFKRLINLKFHLRSHGTVVNKNSLKITDEQCISKKELPFVCSQCGEMLSEDQLCITHSTYHVYSIYCDLCGKPFENEMSLNRHLNNVHVNKHHKCNAKDGGFPFQCNNCSAFFKLEFELEDHYETHENIRYQCHVCVKTFLAECEFQEHLKCHDQENHESEETM